MKIYSDSFKRWNRILEIYQAKGNPVGESLYFNFADSYVYFGNTEGIGRVKFFYEKELETEIIPNFFISTVKFLNVITQYDYLNLDSKLLFTNGKDKFKISTIIDDDQIDCTTLQTAEFNTELVLEKEHFEGIVKALGFASKDEGNTNYRNIFIQNKFICSLTSKTPLYEAPINVDSNVAISLNVAKLIIQIGSISDGCTICTNSKATKKIISKDAEIELIVPSNADIEFPDNRKPEFISSYEYETTLKVDSDIFGKVLSLLSPYFVDVMNSKISISIEDDIAVKVADSTNEVERHIPFIEVSPELEHTTFSISGDKVVHALSVLKGKELFIDVSLEDSSPIVNFYNVKGEAHILIVRFKN